MFLFARFSVQVQVDCHAISSVLLFVDSNEEQGITASPVEIYGSTPGQSCHLIK